MGADDERPAQRPTIGSRAYFTTGRRPLDLTDPLTRRRYLLAWLDRRRLDRLEPGAEFVRDHVPGEFSGWEEGIAAETGRVRVWRSDAARSGRQLRMRSPDPDSTFTQSDGEDAVNRHVQAGPPPGDEAAWQRELDALPAPPSLRDWRAEREALLETARSAVLADLGELTPDVVRVEEAQGTYGRHLLVSAAGATTHVRTPGTDHASEIWSFVHRWYPSESDDRASAVRDLANQVQQAAIMGSWATGEARPWPPCPEHPGAHPLRAEEPLRGEEGVDRIAVWACPRRGSTRIPIGRLREG